MLGTIEDLEKDIEQFRLNVAASNEMYMLLKQMIEQIKQQNVEFGSKSDALIGRLDGIPASLSAANTASNATVKKDVSVEVDRALYGLSQEQSKYMQALEQMQQKIQSYIEQSQQQTSLFNENSADIIAKTEKIPGQIKEDTRTSLETHLSAVDADLEKRNTQFADIQQRYILAAEETSNRLKTCEDQLTGKYQDFLQTMERTNLSNLYEQNQRLQSELNKRTAILMAISAVSVVLGIIGLIF